MGQKTGFTVYCVALTGAASALVAGLVVVDRHVGSPAALVALCALSAYADRHVVRLSASAEISATSVVFILAAVLFGPLAAILSGTVGVLTHGWRWSGEERVLRSLVWAETTVLIAGATGLAAAVSGGVDPHSVSRIAASVLAASVAEFVADALLAPLPGVLRGNVQWSDLVRTVVPMQMLALPFYVPLIGFLAFSYIRVSPWSVLLFVAPALAAQRLFLLYQNQRETSEQLRVANGRLASANLAFATGLVATLEARDRYTAGHSAAVAIYAQDIAARLGLAPEEQQKAQLCGLVHDIGKVGLPAVLLEKTGALSPEERAQMQRHPVIGQRILEKIEGYGDIALIVRHHHERPDGSGYPDRLSGETIPLISRIIAVADAYNAMTSDRPYRRALPSEVARVRLASAVGTQFDTAVVAAFEAILTAASDDYRVGSRPDFALDLRTSSPRMRLVGAA